MIERRPVDFQHERRFGWLLCLLNGYASKKRLGIVLGSRSAVQIDQFSGRMPELLFVRADRQNIIQDHAIYGAQDLVIEIVSPNDSGADLLALESDYRSIGVAEIVFWNARKREVLVRRKRGENYSKETLTQGEFALESVPGFRLDVQSLVQDPLPDEFEILKQLLS